MHDKNPNVETLNMVYQGARMGVETISYILPKVNGQSLKKDLASQMLGYHNFVKSSSCQLHDINHYPQEITLMAKIPAYTSLQVKSMIDNSGSHIAEMMIEGSTMGIIEMQRNLNKNKNLTAEVVQTGQDIISFEQENIEKLKAYL
jgi:hypothetical protein